MKSIIFNFFKDKLFITLVYFINTSILILFFYLYVDKTIPILYPLALAGFIYMLFICFGFYRYYSFNLSIFKISKNEDIEIDAKTYEQKAIKDAIYNINSRYIDNINALKEENKINNKFFSQWVHNMKTPVSVIEIIIQKVIEKLDASSFNKEKDLSSVCKLIDELRAENNKMLNGLDQILSMIRLEDFSKDYSPEAVNLYDSLKNVINERKSQFIYNNVFPKIICEDNYKNVLTDRKWNEFMIGQIISNAIKYSRKCGEDKNISKFVFFNIKEDGNYIILTIKDEGIGIPSYDINRVFEAFFTGENGRKYSHSTGIGLYICKVISEKLGHDIFIESELGQGTKLKIKYLLKL